MLFVFEVLNYLFFAINTVAFAADPDGNFANGLVGLTNLAVALQIGVIQRS